jgi:hypothetical protein
VRSEEKRATSVWIEYRVLGHLIEGGDRAGTETRARPSLQASFLRARRVAKHARSRRQPRLRRRAKVVSCSRHGFVGGFRLRRPFSGTGSGRRSAGGTRGSQHRPTMSCMKSRGVGGAWIGERIVHASRRIAQIGRDRRVPVRGRGASCSKRPVPWPGRPGQGPADRSDAVLAGVVCGSEAGDAGR